ncbi:MAG TPA: VanZ family protein [Chthoniobacterales bacterium]|nr:VanZ family protein [Chthoniobacterales bacterium]
MKFRALLKAWLPVALWMSLMFVGSTDALSAEHTSRLITPLLLWLKPDMSPATIAFVHLLVRKAAHVTEYAILTGLLFRALREAIDGFWRRAAMAFLPAIIFAATDEYHQRFVPSRTSSLGDVGIDACGAAVGILICRVVHLCLTRRGKNDSLGDEITPTGTGPERI